MVHKKWGGKISKEFCERAMRQHFKPEDKRTMTGEDGDDWTVPLMFNEAFFCFFLGPHIQRARFLFLRTCALFLFAGILCTGWHTNPRHDDDGDRLALTVQSATGDWIPSSGHDEQQVISCKFIFFFRHDSELL